MDQSTYIFTHTHAHTHTHILLLFFLICREQNSRGSKRPKARRGILIRMLGGPLLYRPRTSSAVVVSNKQQEQSLAGMSEAGGGGRGGAPTDFVLAFTVRPFPPRQNSLSPPHPTPFLDLSTSLLSRMLSGTTLLLSLPSTHMHGVRYKKEQMPPQRHITLIRGIQIRGQPLKNYNFSFFYFFFFFKSFLYIYLATFQCRRYNVKTN